MSRETFAALAEAMMDLVDSAKTLREMREAEALCEEMTAEHGRHPLVTGAIEEISRRILHEECGEQGEERMALTQQEESTLRRVAAENTPMRVLNPMAPTSETAGDDREIERLTRRYLAAPRALTGTGQDGKYHLEGEDEIVRRVRHTMKKGEKLIEWFARVGLGRSQIFSMSRSEIEAFAEQADRNNEESGVREPRESSGARNWTPPQAPQPRALDTWAE